MVKVAILVDGGFYRQRAYHLFGEKTAKERANELERYCRSHLKDKREQRELYRIFYYDCPPMAKKLYHPLLGKQIDFGRSDMYKWMNEFISELTHRRKFCMRMGKLAEEQATYSIRYEIIKKLCSKAMTVDELTEADFSLQITQKGVDMKIGIDISSLAFKQQVDQIILISGDSDFVPAAKLARREGIDFILDPMRSPIKPDLYEHVDGIRSKVPNPRKIREAEQPVLEMQHE